MDNMTRSIFVIAALAALGFFYLAYVKGDDPTKMTTYKPVITNEAQ